MGLVGCEEGLRLRREGKKCDPHGFRRPKTSDEGTDSGTAKFNGWAIKWTPNAMKHGRRSVYTIIGPHDKMQPIPRIF